MTIKSKGYEHPHEGNEVEEKPMQAEGEETQRLTPDAKASFARRFEDQNGRPLEKMFGRPGDEIIHLNSSRLIDSWALSYSKLDKRPGETQAALTEMYEQELEKVFAANEPTDETKSHHALLGRGDSLERKWDKKKNLFKEILSTQVELQWARLESQDLRGTKSPELAYQAVLLNQDHEKLKRLGIEPSALVEKTAASEDMPIDVNLFQPINSRLGKAPEIRILVSPKESGKYRDPNILSSEIYQVARQIEDVQREGNGFLGLNKGKKEQKISELENRKAQLEKQKQEAERAKEQEKINAKSIKEVMALLDKVNAYEFSANNFKTDGLDKAKTLGELTKALNLELQKLGQTQPSPEQAQAQAKVSRTENRLKQAEAKADELEQTRQRLNYIDMRSDTLSTY